MNNATEIVICYLSHIYFLRYNVVFIFTKWRSYRVCCSGSKSSTQPRTIISVTKYIFLVALLLSFVLHLFAHLQLILITIRVRIGSVVLIHCRSNFPLPVLYFMRYMKWTISRKFKIIKNTNIMIPKNALQSTKGSPVTRVLCCCWRLNIQYIFRDRMWFFTTNLLFILRACWKLLYINKPIDQWLQGQIYC